MFHNAQQACSRTAGLVGLCFMTTTKACKGTGVSGSGRAMVWDRYGLGLGLWLEMSKSMARAGVRVGKMNVLGGGLMLEWGQGYGDG